jgi:MFS family permease
MDTHTGDWGARLRVKGRRPFLAAMVIDSVGTGMFLPFTVLYFVHTAGLTAPAVGVALTVAGFVVLPAPLAVAPGIDRFPAKTVVAAGNLISCAAFAAYLFVHGQLAVTVAAVVAGVGQAVFWTGTRALISEVAPPGERRSWFALQTAIRYAGYGLGGLAGAAVVSLHSPAGFKALAAIDALSYLAAAVLLISWRQPPPAAKSATPPAPDSARSSYWSALTDRPLAAITAINTAFVLCAQVLTVVLSVYVTGTLHLAAWIAGMLFTLNTLLIATGQAPLTRATRRIPHRHVLRGAAAAWAAALGLLWAASVLPRGARAGMLVAAITIFTLAEILQGPVINALVVELAPAGHPGRHLSIFQLSWSVGQTIAPAVLLGLLSAGPRWLWATIIGLCLIIFLGINHLAPHRPQLPPPETVSDRSRHATPSAASAAPGGRTAGERMALTRRPRASETRQTCTCPPDRIP